MQETEIEAFVIPKEVEGQPDKDGRIDISHWHLKTPVIYFNRADAEEVGGNISTIKITITHD